MSPEEAQRRAHVAFGNLPLVREDGRDVWGWRWLDTIHEDLRIAIRSLRRAPTHSVVATCVLALGIGASTAIFSVVDAVVLRALPFDEHDRLVAVGGRRQDRPAAQLSNVAPQDFTDWRGRQTTFDGLAAIANDRPILREPGTEPEELRAQRVTSDFFSVLRTRPRLGRPFTPADEVDGRDRLVILSDGFWHSRFGADPDIIGRTVRLEWVEPTTYEIVGVMPPEFSYPVAAEQPTQVWMPYVVPEDERIRQPNRISWSLRPIARLKDGVSIEAAAAEMDHRILFSYVTADYHRSMGIPLRRGRYLEDADTANDAPVVLLNELAAAQFFPGENPVGQTVEIGEPHQIVGVVGDVRLRLEADAPARAYLPGSAVSSFRLMIKTAGDPVAMLPAVRAAVHAVLPDVPLRGVSTMEATLGRLLAQRRLSMLLLGLFGILGLVISAVGIYGLMSYVVAQRTHEIGVRMALGATRARVVRMVVSRAAALTAAGLAAGVIATRLLSTSAEAFLFQLEPTDVRVFAIALVVLTATALAASAVPARRSATIDPMTALRQE